MKQTRRMKRTISLALAVSGLFSWSGPVHALKPIETSQGSGLEELDQKLRSVSSVGLEEWGPGPDFRLHLNPSTPIQTPRAVLDQFTPRGDQLWMTLLSHESRNWSKFGFLLTDANENRISQADAIVHRTDVLRKIILAAEKAGSLPQGTWQGIWLPDGGRVNFKNPKTLSVLTSEPVRAALAENKRSLMKLEAERRPEDEPGLLALTLEKGAESAVAFYTAGDDPNGWYPFAEILVIDQQPSNTRLLFSSRHGVLIDREVRFRARQAERAAAASGLEENVLSTRTWAASIAKRAAAGEIEVVQRGSIELRGTAITEDAVYAQAQTVHVGGWFLPRWDVSQKRLEISPPKPITGPPALVVQSHSGAITAVAENKRTVILRRAEKPDVSLEPFAFGSVVGVAFSPQDDKLVAWSRPSSRLEVWDLTPLADSLPPKKLKGVGIRAGNEIGFNDRGTLVSVRSSPEKVSWWDPVRGAFHAGLEEEVEEYKPEDPWPWLDEIMKKVDADEITTFQRTGRMLTKATGQLTREKIRQEVSLVADKNSQGVFGWSVDGKTLHLTLLTSVPSARETPSTAVNPSARPKADILVVALPGQPVQESLMSAWASFSDKDFPVGRSGGTMAFSPEQAWQVLQPGQSAASAGGALIVHDIRLPEETAFGTDPGSFQNFGLNKVFGLIYNIRTRLTGNAFPIAVLIRVSDKDSERAQLLHQAAYTLAYAELGKYATWGWGESTSIDFIERNDSIPPPTIHRSLGRVLWLIGKQSAASGLEEKIVSLYAPAPVISVAFNRPGHEVQMAALTQDGQVLAYSSSGTRHEYRRDILSNAPSSRPALSASIPGALRVAFRAGGAGIFVSGAHGGVTFDAYYQTQSRQHPVRLEETGIHPTELPPGGAALSPDRKRLFVAAGDHQARIWNMAPEDEALFSGGTRPAGLIAELTLDRGNISAVGYGPHGLLALGTDDGQIEIRRVTDEIAGTIRPVTTLQRHIGPVTAVRFSPSGKYVASADRNGRIILWDTESWEPLHEMSHPAGSAVYALEFHGRHEVDRKDQQRKFKILSLASAGDDGVIRFWDHHSGELQSELAIQPEARVNTLAFSWDGTRLIAGLQRPVNTTFAVMAKVPPAKAGLEEGPVHVVLSNGRTKLAAGVNDFTGPIGELDENQPPPVSVEWDTVKKTDLAGRTPLERSLSVFGDKVEEALEFHGISADRLEQIGIATTGFGDFPAGVIMMENLPGHGLDVMQDLKTLFEQEFQRRFGRLIPVVFFNDGVAGVLGEHNLPEGALHDVQDGIFVIVGGGVGSGEMEGGKPVYAVPGVIDAFLNEIGWHTVTTDGGTTWVWRGEGATQENLVPNPASGPNEWALEQHTAGPFMAARAVKWMQDRGRGDVFGEEIGISMDSKQNLSKTDRPVVSSVKQQTLVLKKMTELGRQGDADALEFIRDSGRALGAGLGAFRQRFQDRAFARGRVAIGSSVGEKFGMGIEGDPFLTELKKAIGTDDVVRTTKTGVKREWAFSMPQKPAGLEEDLRKAQLAFHRAAPPIFAPWTPEVQRRALVVDLSADPKLGQLAWMLSIMQTRQPDNAPEFRVVVESGLVNRLLKQWITVDEAAALELTDRLVTYEPGEGAAANAVERAQQDLASKGFVAAGSIQVISQLTLDLAASLRAFFTAGGLNFVTDEAYQRFEAVLQSA